jgi:hypothetical protein
MPKASVATDRVDLKRRGAAYSGIAPNLEVKPAYWNAVFKDYGVKPLEHRIAAGTHLDQAFSEIWHDLAISLLRVHVRAFALRGRAGRKQQSHRICHGQSGANDGDARCVLGRGRTDAARFHRHDDFA